MQTNTNILFSTRVIKSLRELPESARKNVADALFSELVLGEEKACDLPDFDYLIFSLIVDNIKRDSYRFDNRGA